MKTMKHPIRYTIIYGIFCAIAFVPLTQLLNVLIPWPRVICLTLWCCLAGYAIMLNLWSEKMRGQTVFPLLILLPAIFLNNSIALFFILALIAAGWIRSGICYPETGARGIAVELLLGFFAILPVIVLTPGSVSAWALGTWMFFLIQALYFIFIDITSNHRNSNVRPDAFDEASKKAERILAGSY
jgi:hypothetical protein